MAQMYKVFLNNKCIYLTLESDPSVGRGGKVHQFYSVSALTETIEGFERDRKADCLYITGDPDKLIDLFPVINAAGGLVKKPNDQILFIFRYGKWDLPKGKMEEGESVSETALREVAEETGVTGLKITKELIPTFHTYKMDGKRVIKKTHWFEMTFADDSQILPQAIEDITVVKWLSQKDIPWAMRDSYASVIELLTTSGYL
ncbi:MAG: NUDIX domain-containing protein [Bacteroidales bacterium]